MFWQFPELCGENLFFSLLFWKANGRPTTYLRLSLRYNEHVPFLENLSGGIRKRWLQCGSGNRQPWREIFTKKKALGIGIKFIILHFGWPLKAAGSVRVCSTIVR